MGSSGASKPALMSRRVQKVNAGVIAAGGFAHRPALYWRDEPARLPHWRLRHARHPASAELHDRLVHRDEQGRRYRPWRIGGCHFERGCTAWPDLGPDLDHPRPPGSRGRRGGDAGKEQRSDHRTTEGRSVLDRPHRRKRPDVRPARRASLHARPLAGRRRHPQPGRDPVGGAPLSRTHARSRHLLQPERRDSLRSATCCSRGRSDGPISP